MSSITNPPDGLSGNGSAKQAELIREFWATRGRFVEIHTEPLVMAGFADHGGTIYQIRSDMLNGWPRT